MSRHLGLAGAVVAAAAVLGLLAFPSVDPPGPPEPIPEDVEDRLQSVVFPIRGEQRGTAFAVVAPDAPLGTMLTAAHVVGVESEGQRVGVEIAGRTHRVLVRRVDPAADVAVLFAAGYDGPALNLSAIPAAEGDLVVLAGYPAVYAGAADPRLICTRGRVDDPTAPWPDETAVIADRPGTLLRVTGTSHHGGSGGPAVDDAGEVLGLTTAATFGDRTRTRSVTMHLVPTDRLLAVLGGRPDTRGVPDTRSPPTDSDGDGIADRDEPDAKFLAAAPAPFVAVESIELGLREETTSSAVSLTSDERLSSKAESRSASQYEGKTTRTTLSSTSYSGGATVAVGQYTVPIGYRGHHEQRTREVVQESRSELAFERSAVEEARRRTEQLFRGEARIGPRAGFIRLNVRLRNLGTAAVVLRGFDVNLRSGGTLWRTLRAADAANGFGERRLPPDRGTETVSLVFENLNTEEVRERITGPSGLTARVPAGSLRTDGFPRESEIRNRCAEVLLAGPHGPQTFFVSTVADTVRPNGREVSVESLLARLPVDRPDETGSPIEWGGGPLGDYLARFAGEDGVPVLLPDSEERGRWVAFLGGTELTGDWRGRGVRPNDLLELRHVRPRDYWGETGSWETYAGFYERLLKLRRDQFNFWHQLRSYNTPSGGAWNVTARDTTRADAKGLLTTYRDLFTDPELPAPIRRAFPDAAGRTAEFERWFGDGIHFPEWSVEVNQLDAAWGMDRELNLGVESLRVGGVTTGDDSGFVLEQGERSGAVRFKKPLIFTWSPFAAVELKLVDYDGFNETALFSRSDGFLSLDLLIGRLPLERLDEPLNDPQTTWARFDLELRPFDRNGEPGAPVPQDRFAGEFEARLPAVVGVVGAELSPYPFIARFRERYTPPDARVASLLAESAYRSRRERNEARWLPMLHWAVMEAVRSFDFARAAELAGELPDDRTLSKDYADQLAAMPGGLTAADTRHLGEVAGRLAAAPPTSPTHDAAVRVLLHGMSARRLRHRVDAGNGGLSPGDRDRWAAKLREALADDRGRIARDVDDSLLRHWLPARIARSEAMLDTDG